MTVESEVTDNLEIALFDIQWYIMKVLTVEDKVASVGNENEPTVVVDTQKLTKEELNK